MLPLCAEMLLKCGYEKGDKFNLFFLAGCLIFGQIGMTLFPFLGWSLMTVGTMMQLTQTMISYPQYIAIMAIFGILSFITYPFLMKICGCKFDKLATVDIQTAFPNVKADAKLTVAAKFIHLVGSIVCRLCHRRQYVWQKYRIFKLH